MFCPKCGTQVEEGSRFCLSCGYDLSTRAEATPIPMRPVQARHSVQAGAASPRRRQVPQQRGFVPDVTSTSYASSGTIYEQKIAQAISEGLGMNWFKFIVYIQCFVGALGMVITGVTEIIGLQYGNRASFVYDYYTGLKAVDVVYGLVCIAIALVLVYAGIGLRKFRASAVGVYLFLPLIQALISVLYLCAGIIATKTSSIVDALLGTSVGKGGSIGLVLGLIIQFAINYIYFAHRRHLFDQA